MAVLSSDQRAFFDENGYIVVPSGIPQENLDAVVDLIWEFLGMDPKNPDDWYRPPLEPAGFVNVYQHPALWANRQHPRVHQIFADLFGTEKLWVSLDRAGMKPPQNPKYPDYDHKGFIHWDLDTTKLPVPFAVQGVLALTDTDETQGGFQCIPGFHKNLEEWIKTQPADRDPRHPDLTGLTVKPIPAKAGDLVIWIRTLAHGNGHNVSDRPRFAQYITMYPAAEDDEETRQKRIHLYRHRINVQSSRYREPIEPVDDIETPDLTPLGRKLLGVDRWE